MLSLQMVTMTGADDSVNPEELISISRDYPFVEWGILIGDGSSKRFPCLPWIRTLVDLSLNEETRPRLSLHICGCVLKKVKTGLDIFEATKLDYRLAAFNRCQLNWHGERQRDIGDRLMQSFCISSYDWDPQIIFQLDGVNDLLYKSCAKRFLVGGLFDTSHGAGITPDEWPKPHAEMQSGYAGGLGPDNLSEQLKKIEEVTDFRPIWIDMETKIRSDNDEKFDLDKVVQCLDIAEKFV